MSLSRLETLYSWVNNLGPNTKTFLIMVLGVVVLNLGVNNYTRAVLEDYERKSQTEKHLAEKYTEMVTPIINKHVEYILSQDKDATNVILLNYHNTLVSTHGLSYRYLTSLTERKRGLKTKGVMRIWKELDYVNYGDEIGRIHDNQYLRIDSIDSYVEAFPNLTELLERSGATSAAFYPIMGIDAPVGMVVVIYHSKKDYELGYYNTVISGAIQPLAIILDYNSVKEKFKKEYECRQEE